MKLNHIAFIMDGNRRYARKQHISFAESYKKGMIKFLEVLSLQIKYNLKITTFFALSGDNYLKRPNGEKKILSNLLIFFSKDERIENFIKDNKIKINIFGDIDLIEKEFKDTEKKNIIKKGVELKKELFTKLKEKYDLWNESIKNDFKFIVNIALNYDGQKEILHSFKEILYKIESGKLNSKEISLDTIKQNIQFKEQSPEIIVRFGNISRLSGFLLWDSKYSEIYFSKKLWPEFSESDLYSIFSWYNNQNRNFGK